jgi:hypothetical protein
MKEAGYGSGALAVFLTWLMVTGCLLCANSVRDILYSIFCKMLYYYKILFKTGGFFFFHFILKTGSLVVDNTGNNLMVIVIPVRMITPRLDADNTSGMNVL